MNWIMDALQSKRHTHARKRVPTNEIATNEKKNGFVKKSNKKTRIPLGAHVHTHRHQRIIMRGMGEGGQRRRA